MNAEAGQRDNISDDRERVRVIEDLELRNPAMNMGLEEAIVETVSRGRSLPTIRLWRNPHSAIIGRSQETEVEIDVRNCKSAEIPIIRRPTGGGAVLHHPNNLNYSIYLPESSRFSVEEESVKMSEPVASALSEYGLDVRVKPNGLFSGPIKLGGTAQSRRRGLLHHGTLLVKNDSIIEEMSSFLRAGKGGYSEVVSRVASKPDTVSNLENLVRGRIRLGNLVEGIAYKLGDILNWRPAYGRISDEEWRIGSRLADVKYSSLAWNFRFSEKSVEEELLTKTGSGSIE
ncbi:lipoate--protein ligase family protein [Candidatus Bipolaricaulota bacterium]|nr:lipoate--protein ligase family protein [Candidatus Bipolaricaulota bacterium]